MWTVEYTKRFLKDLADLPTEIKTRGNAIDFWEERSVTKLMDASQHKWVDTIIYTTGLRLRSVLEP